MMNPTRLESLQNINIETVSKDELIELSSVQIRQELPHVDKIMDFISQVHNPYCFLSGNLPIKVCFSENGPLLKQVLEDYFIRIKQG